jgi:hypothetical protein
MMEQDQHNNRRALAPLVLYRYARLGATSLSRAPTRNRLWRYQITFIATWMIRPGAAELITPNVGEERELFGIPKLV